MKKMIKYIFLVILVSTAFSARSVELGVYFLWDGNINPASDGIDSTEFPERSDQLILEANEFYEESGIDVTLVNTGIRVITMTFNDAAALREEISQSLNEFSNILAEADKRGADFITAIPLSSRLQEQMLCGQAFLNRSRDTISDAKLAVSVMQFRCGAETFAHELGHNMGLAHGTQVAQARANNIHSNGLTTYARGWGRIVNLVSAGDTSSDERIESGEYGTIMAGNNTQYWTNSTSSLVQVPLFSGPNNFHTTCSTTNTPDQCGDTSGGDSSRVINENRFTYASHQEPDVDFLSYKDVNFQTCIQSNYRNFEIVDLTNLNCSNQKIRSLDGIQQLTSLSIINLTNNNLINIDPLETVLSNNAQLIDLTGNENILCHQLQRLDDKYPGRIVMPSECFNLAAVLPALFIL